MILFAVYLDKDNMRFWYAESEEALAPKIRKLGYDPATVIIKKCPIK